MDRGNAFLIATIAMVAGSNIGLGYLLGFIASLRKWGCWPIGLISLLISLIWPALMLGMAINGGRHYQRLGPNDPGDAPVYVIMGAMMLSPLLMIICLPLAALSALIARSVHSPAGSKFKM